MGRGRYPARLNVAPPPPEVAARYLLSWQSRDLYARPEQFPEISSPGLFGDERPLELDIGCAVGDFLGALAAQHPEANYLGVDIVAKPLYRAVATAVELDLPNVRFLHCDMLLAYRRIPDGGLRAAYVHFPAPLLRNRQRKQRLVSAELLAQMGRALRPGGTLSLLTDQEAVYQELLSLLPGAPALRPLPPEEHPLAMGDLLKSHYHRRWEQRGRRIWHVVLVR